MKKISCQSLPLVLGTFLCLSAAPLLLVTGCAGDRYHQSTGEAIDDHNVSSRVKHSLSEDPEYKFDRVEVHTFKGTVQLSGFVDTAAQRTRAGRIAREVQGAHDVENNITVKD